MCSSWQLIICRARRRASSPLSPGDTAAPTTSATPESPAGVVEIEQCPNVVDGPARRHDVDARRQQFDGTRLRAVQRRRHGDLGSPRGSRFGTDEPVPVGGDPPHSLGDHAAADDADGRRRRRRHCFGSSTGCQPPCCGGVPPPRPRARRKPAMATANVSATRARRSNLTGARTSKRLDDRGRTTSLTAPTPLIATFQLRPPSLLVNTSPLGSATTASSPAASSWRGPTAPPSRSGRPLARAKPEPSNRYTAPSHQHGRTMPRPARVVDDSDSEQVRGVQPLRVVAPCRAAILALGEAAHPRRRPHRAVRTDGHLVHVVVQVDSGRPRRAVPATHDPTDVHADVEIGAVGSHREHRRRSTPRRVPILVGGRCLEGRNPLEACFAKAPQRSGITADPHRSVVGTEARAGPPSSRLATSSGESPSSRYRSRLPAAPTCACIGAKRR